MFYDQSGNYDWKKHGPVFQNLDKIEKQKGNERKFVTHIRSWLCWLLFEDIKLQIEYDYEDLSTINYPHHKRYLDYRALCEGSINRETSLEFKEILLLIILVLDFIRMVFE